MPVKVQIFDFEMRQFSNWDRNDFLYSIVDQHSFTVPAHNLFT